MDAFANSLCKRHQPLHSIAISGVQGKGFVMKIRNIAIGIAVVGAMIAGGVAAVAWQNAAVAPRTI